MNKQLKIKLQVLLPAVFICFTSLNGQEINFCQQAALIIKNAEKFHFKPRKIDDQFSADVFDGFINLIDPGRMYLTSSDIRQLEHFRDKSDDYITAQNCQFIDETESIYRQKLQYLEKSI